MCRILHRAPLLAELAGHHGAELLDRGGARDPVGGGEEVAFERRSLGREIPDQRGIASGAQKVGGFQEIEAPTLAAMSKMLLPSGYHKFVKEDVATRDAIQNAGRAIGASETIFAGLQLLAGIDGAQQQKLPRVADDAMLRQLIGHVLAAGSFWKIDNHLVAKTLVGSFQGNVGHACGDYAQDDEEEQNTDARFMIAGSPGSFPERITAARRSTALARFSMLTPLSRSTRWACTVVRRSSHN